MQNCIVWLRLQDTNGGEGHDQRHLRLMERTEFGMTLYLRLMNWQ